MTDVLAGPLYDRIRRTFGRGGRGEDCPVTWSGDATLPSAFATTELAVASIAAAGAAIADLVGLVAGRAPPMMADRRLASLWFQWSIQPIGWELPSAWDPIAGDYATADGFIRLHTNAPHHRAAALAVLGVPADKAAVTAAVAPWRGRELEDAVVRAGGCAAVMYSLEAWARHPQGTAVATEPLLAIAEHPDRVSTRWMPRIERPLAGVRVLDLTRVLAGPVATRFLAGFGADVLRLDPPGWDEPGVVPEVTLGKRCARLDLRTALGMARFRALLAETDVLVHGYRADALERLGLGEAERRRIRPGLVDVTLNAYGWSGPWRNRRGFDSLVQMSAGIAHAGMMTSGTAQPKPLPVQALDHATGYLMAAAAIHGLSARLEGHGGMSARLSLARTAGMLAGAPRDTLHQVFPPAAGDEWSVEIEHSAFGPARRLRPPIDVAGSPMHWDRPAAGLGSSEPRW